MRPVRLLLAAAALSGAAAVSALAQAQPAVAASTAAPVDKSQMYNREGPVVKNAASFIGVISVIPAAVVGAVACPVKLVAGKPGDKTYQQRYKDCVAAGTASGTQIAYEVGGFPFLVLKRVFWDIPRRALARASGPKKSPAAPPAAGR